MVVATPGLPLWDLVVCSRGDNCLWQGMAPAIPRLQGKEGKKGEKSEFMNVSVTICVDYSVIK